MIKDYEPSYIVLTPVGEEKLYSLKEHYKYASRLIQPPEKILYTADNDLPEGKRRKIESIGGEVITVDQSQGIDQFGPGGDVHRIGRSREQLRQVFLKTQAMWGFWIDSDILVPEYAFKNLYDVAIKEKALMVSNGYTGRGGNEVVWHGIGCTLTHRRILQAGRFFVMEFGLEKEIEKKMIKHVSEDYTFFNIFSGMDSWIKENLDGWDKVRVHGSFCEVYHWIDSSMPEEYPSINRAISHLKSNRCKNPTHADWGDVMP